MEARQYREAIDIQWISKADFKFYQYMRDRVNAIINPEMRDLPPDARGPVFEAGAADAMNMLRGVSRSYKRSLGYGRR